MAILQAIVTDLCLYLWICVWPYSASGIFSFFPFFSPFPTCTNKFCFCYINGYMSCLKVFGQKVSYFGCRIIRTTWKWACTKCITYSSCLQEWGCMSRGVVELWEWLTQGKQVWLCADEEAFFSVSSCHVRGSPFPLWWYRRGWVDKLIQ